MTATTALGRVSLQLRAAQDASDKLNAFLAKRADAGHYITQIARDLETALALAEASLLAAQPPLHDQVIIGERPAVAAFFVLDLGVNK